MICIIIVVNRRCSLIHLLTDFLLFVQLSLQFHVYSARWECWRSLMIVVFFFSFSFPAKPQNSPPVNSYEGKVTLNIMNGNCYKQYICVLNLIISLHSHKFCSYMYYIVMLIRHSIEKNDKYKGLSDKNYILPLLIEL